MSGDLKAVFGQTKEDDPCVEEKTSWDQEEEERGEKEEQRTLLSSLPSADPSAEKEESSGFQFSFFGDDTETGTAETGGFMSQRFISNLIFPVFKRFPLSFCQLSTR